MTDQVDGLLAGVRVVDATHMLAGPYCTWVLAALGAEVIKIERPGTGDFTRGLAPFHEGESVYFLSVNRGKRSLALDLKDPRGKEVFRRLSAGADILVENNRAGAMDRLGLGYEALRALNPGLIYAAISGFGQDGPYRNRPSFDVIAQALSGMMSITGEEGGAPCRVGTSIGDIGASLFGAVGILAALEKRRRTGEGALIDVAMLDCQIALMENAVARQATLGQAPRALGSRHPLVVPFQAFPTADRPIAVCVDTDAQWLRLCEALERPELANDPRFAEGNQRSANHALLEPLLLEAFAGHGRDHWLAVLEAADVPSGPINAVGEALENPQVRHRAMVTEVPEGSGRRFAALPIKVSGTARATERPAPRLGADRDDLLAELGFDGEAIAAMARDGVA